MPPIEARRPSLMHLSHATTQHPGLWLAKYLEKQQRKDEKGENEWRNELVAQVAELPVPTPYAHFFQRWQATLTGLGAVGKTAYTQYDRTNQQRLAIGLGNEGVLETNISLHHTYGVPYIPASALKGLAAAYARQKLDEKGWQRGDDYYFLFGAGGEDEYNSKRKAERGGIHFFDALYVPESSKGDCPLALDVLTPHHQAYYGEGIDPPADWDSPIPFTFLTATGDYWVALAGDPVWVTKTFEILHLALLERGIGAKTNSGYGRLTFTPTHAVRVQRLLNATPEAGRTRGTVTQITLRPGRHSTGQIVPARGANIFIHESHLREEMRPLRKDQIVEYRVGRDQQGRLQAQEVIVLLQPES